MFSPLPTNMFRSYGMTELRKAMQHPNLMLYETLRVIDESTYARLQNRLFIRRYGTGIDVIKQDWDNLILLDACRYDYFEDLIDIAGTLKQVVSRGSSSWPFMQKNFLGRRLHDTIYVTANLHVEKLPEDVFYTVETIPSSERNPERVASAAITMHDEFPDKRLIVHFMQPHRPYLGPTADRIRKKADPVHLVDTPSVGDGSETHTRPKIAFSLFKSGAYPIDVLHEMYRENLEIALEQVTKLLAELDGKSVISTDHGELLGERKGMFRQRKFGHPNTIYTPECLIVPWFEIQADDRRSIVSEDPIGFDRLKDDVVRRRLEELGYVT